uniref:EGF-like domain-containing protein n=1 Tax=viral metagenome TaxID=1070528 RepID=A0A6C0C7L8_9ZZZZ
MLLLCLLISSVLSGQVISTQYWTGGHCEICGADYACSNGYGNWNGGMQFFTDQVPVGQIVTQVQIELLGKWSCASNPTDITVVLQGTEIQTVSRFGDCACGNCNDPAVLTWNNNGACFPNYNFGGDNILTVTTNGLICPSSTTLTITYGPGNQQSCSSVEPQCSNGCGPNGTCAVDQNTQTASCDCNPYTFGSECQCYIPSYMLSTDHPPVLDVASSGFKSKDTLSLSLQNSMKYYDTQITFRNSVDNTCDYAAPYIGNIWTTTPDYVNCRQNIEGIIPWISAYPTCVVDRSLVGDYLVFEGIMIVNNKEKVGVLANNRPIDIVRTLTNNIIFQILYPTDITITSNNVTVYAVENVVAAITSAVFTVDINAVPGLARVTLLTTVQYPFKMIEPIVLGGDTNRFALAHSQLSDPSYVCADDGNYCAQLWDIVITPNPNECNYNGDYMFNFTLDCQASQTDCPLDAATNTGAISFSLESEDFCPQIVETIDLAGTLKSYSSNTHANLKSSFIVDQTVYFELELTSTKATIVNVVINTVTVAIWDGSSVLLFDSGNTAEGSSLSLVVDDNNNNPKAYFQLQLVEGSFPVAVDGAEQIEFVVDASVTFLNTQKRAIQDQTIPSYKLTATTVISNDQIPGSNTGAVKTLGILSLISLLISIVF